MVVLIIDYFSFLLGLIDEFEVIIVFWVSLVIVFYVNLMKYMFIFFVGLDEVVDVIRLVKVILELIFINLYLDFLSIG